MRLHAQGMVSALAASSDGALLATAGGADCTVNLWSVHVDALAAAEEASYSPEPGEPLSDMVTLNCLPWVRLLGGATGPGSTLDDLVDFFFYSQLRTQGEETTAPRDIKGSVPLSELAPLASALG